MNSVLKIMILIISSKGLRLWNYVTSQSFYRILAPIIVSTTSKVWRFVSSQNGMVIAHSQVMISHRKIWSARKKELWMSSQTDTVKNWNPEVWPVCCVIHLLPVFKTDRVPYVTRNKMLFQKLHSDHLGHDNYATESHRLPPRTLGVMYILIPFSFDVIWTHFPIAQQPSNFQW